MIAFILSMPNRGSWNGRWSQEDKLHVRIYDQRLVPKAYWNKDFYYTWNDGWTACVKVRQVSAAEGRRFREKSSGFCGYDWMIQSILKNGKIVLDKEKEK